MGFTCVGAQQMCGHAGMWCLDAVQLECEPPREVGWGQLTTL